MVFKIGQKYTKIKWNQREGRRGRKIDKGGKKNREREREREREKERERER